MPGRDTTDAIFILHQLQEKHLGKHRPLYFALGDSEKAFDSVHRKVLFWVMRRVGVEKWVIFAVKSMYENAQFRASLNGQFSEEFDIKVGIHRGVVLSSLLFKIVMAVLSRHVKGSQSWLPLRIALRKWSGVNCRYIRGLEIEDHNLERQYRSKRAPCQRK